MPTINLGRVAAFVRSELVPSVTSVVWERILDPMFEDIVEQLTFRDGAWQKVGNLATWQNTILGTLSAPPGAPDDGDRYLIGASPTGLWAGRDDQIAEWTDANSIWIFTLPVAGMVVRDENAPNNNIVYNGTAWVEVGIADVFTVAIDYTVKIADTVFVDASAGDVTITLPLAATSDNFVVNITRIDDSANDVFITPTGSDLFNGVNASITVFLQFDYFEISCDSAEWVITG